MMNEGDDRLIQDIADELLQLLSISSAQSMLLAQTAVSLSHTWTYLTSLARKLEALRLKPLCTATCISTEHHTHGTLRYRALHGKDVCCPLHGTPAPGNRLRPRLRPIDVDRVRAAIDRWQQCTDLDRQASTLQAQMRHLEKALSAYQASPFPSKIHHSPTRPEHAEGFTIHHSLFPPEQQ